MKECQANFTWFGLLGRQAVSTSVLTAKRMGMRALERLGTGIRLFLMAIQPISWSTSALNLKKIEVLVIDSYSSRGSCVYL